ncbi:Hydroxyneurosporene synthase (CrtC) [Caballeronia arationis]|jgi:predicted secreted hydrolase|uniref:Predicted secreted hydrolase n=2 Tax=Caballeronia arationis TaxID=1777142 RepID=A0A7Z7N6I1_9BURK|nr:carotenoid 1,2-hydratase [Caballeronia arationis]SAL04618.1 Hydroxyneurosporene synthase (CrtC) [Caballeronia arationis]SOE88094.1 Predicted secreted hydrolase [Caballeronia arationis]
MRHWLLALSMILPFAAVGADFAPVVPEHAIDYPRDTGAHPAFRTEWWYATGWLDTPDRQPLGFQITFFRSKTGKGAENPSAFAPAQLVIAHVALSDPAYGRLVHDQKIAREGLGLAWARPGNTDVKLEAWTMLRGTDGRYAVNVDAAGFALHLTLAPTQAPLIQGERGYSQKGPRPEQASYYYSEPHLQVSGSVTRPAASDTAKGATVDVTGSAWLDHEWSSTLLSDDASGWDWLGANLADGAALMAFKVRGRDGRAVWAHAALRERDGRTTQYGPGDVDFTPQRQWRSPRTDTTYPVAMTVRAGPWQWRLTPLIDDQELDSRDSTGALYWEGAVTLNGIGQNAQGKGRGYLELTGYAKAVEMEKR